MNTVDRRTHGLTAAWERLEAVCRRLWDENSTTAVEAQAVVEEFKGEVHRVDAHVANLDELRAHDRRESEDALAAMRREYELEMAGLKKRLELNETALREKAARIDELLKTLARKEEENLEFHSQVLRMAASSDETKSKKMEEFYAELMKKEAAQAETWQQRRQSLEAEHAQIQGLQTARQGELDAWDQRRVREEEALTKKATDLEIKSQQLAQEYRKKQQEIEDLKSGLQRSIADLVRQYQSRLRTDPPPTPTPR